MQRAHDREDGRGGDRADVRDEVGDRRDGSPQQRVRQPIQVQHARRDEAERDVDGRREQQVAGNLHLDAANDAYRVSLVREGGRDLHGAPQDLVAVDEEEEHQQRDRQYAGQYLRRARDDIPRGERKAVRALRNVARDRTAHEVLRCPAGRLDLLRHRLDLRREGTHRRGRFVEPAECWRGQRADGGHQPHAEQDHHRHGGEPARNVHARRRHDDGIERETNEAREHQGHQQRLADDHGVEHREQDDAGERNADGTQVTRDAPRAPAAARPTPGWRDDGGYRGARCHRRGDRCGERAWHVAHGASSAASAAPLARSPRKLPAAMEMTLPIRSAVPPATMPLTPGTASGFILILLSRKPEPAAMPSTVSGCSYPRAIRAAAGSTVSTRAAATRARASVTFAMLLKMPMPYVPVSPSALPCLAASFARVAISARVAGRVSQCMPRRNTRIATTSRMSWIAANTASAQAHEPNHCARPQPANASRVKPSATAKTMAANPMNSIMTMPLRASPISARSSFSWAPKRFFRPTPRRRTSSTQAGMPSFARPGAVSSGAGSSTSFRPEGPSSSMRYAPGENRSVAQDATGQAAGGERQRDGLHRVLADVLACRIQPVVRAVQRLAVGFLAAQLGLFGLFSGARGTVGRLDRKSVV